MKKIQVQAKLGPAFAIEVAAGDHQLYIDQPKAGGGTDTGPSPLEYLFAALAGCVGSIGRIVANQQRLPVRGMDIRVEGELDPAVLLGRSTGTRAGFQQIVVTVDVDADLSEEQKRAFLQEVDRRCPVSENLLNATPVAVRLAQPATA
ncbi:OsmC family protein [Plasticicumulans sp.]|uniref:OsmC family protein n=1 Tax=Plasticicumulans sp. TaxID=2307179 RepID=UPI002C10D8FC|nr:OsmC family protein [Plasticicumulans sp.]MBS0602133.1 OsmC family protein [Pseudomonadota bacterium]HMW30739.1 OsmC family protein [Plasticicumulans sp.]HMZ12428.1 OsmC family protein [Plasticicumulans sp.]HNB91119.1 OsmC family protein [Plasticicumulans sp.]HNG51237.1 OsmC family protein [Plasticicumulans sp.]